MNKARRHKAKRRRMFARLDAAAWARMDAWARSISRLFAVPPRFLADPPRWMP